VSQPKLSSAASIRLETMFSRIYSTVLAVLHLEVIANAVFQSQYLGLGKWWVLTYVSVPIIGMVLHAWLRGSLGFWPYVHGATVLLAMWRWPLLVVDPTLLPDNFQAWIWWMVGMATISMGIANPRWLGWVYLVVASASWYILDTSIYGGSGDWDIALQNAVYVLLLGGAVASLVRLSREGAIRADEANSVAIANAVEQARVDAIERERQRMDALVHDRVLNTLLVAAKASSEAEQKTAAVAATEAIASLESALAEQDSEIKVTVLGLYRSLRKAALRASKNISIEILSAGLDEVPEEIAQTVTEATLQAIDNALRHSNASQIQLLLGEPDTKEIFVQVIDNGKGFNPERLPKDRLGVRSSIQARMSSVGGQANISSAIGVGTTVELRWSK
jgi:signal transduction histidine kinase